MKMPKAELFPPDILNHRGWQKRQGLSRCCTQGAYAPIGRETMQDGLRGMRRGSLRGEDLGSCRTERTVSFANDEDLVEMLGEELRDVLASIADEDAAAPASEHQQPLHPVGERERSLLGNQAGGEGRKVCARGDLVPSTRTSEAPSKPIALPLRTEDDDKTSSPSTSTFFWDDRWSAISSLIDMGLDQEDAAPAAPP